MAKKNIGKKMKKGKKMNKKMLKSGYAGGAPRDSMFNSKAKGNADGN